MAGSVKLPDGVTVENLKQNYDNAMQDYSKAFKRANILDATDRGRLWDAVSAKFPSYQIRPDTNHVSYVKSNLVASIYTVGKAARLIPTDPGDSEAVADVNMFLDYIWGAGNVMDYQMMAGERAALLNIGVTQVGWDAELTGGAGDFSYTGAPTLKNINPLKFLMDPYADSIETAAYCITYDVYHKSVLLKNPLYAASFQAYLNANSAGAAVQPPTEPKYDRPSDSMAKDKGYYTLINHWVRVDGLVHEIHTIDNAYVLFVKPDIKPSTMPFSILYCNLPSGDVIGTSEPAKIFANSLAYNLLNSVLLTREYKNQRPTKFISGSSGLNVAAFSKYGNDADQTFVVQGDASKAVHYHEQPQPSPQTFSALQTITADIQSITGIDGHYSGKDTGSILTTGGIDSMLTQATLIDMPKIRNYETYTKRLTRLIVANLTEFGFKRKFMTKDSKTQAYKEIEIDFEELPPDTAFTYELSISSELPKTKERIAQKADVLMEKQMQYQQAGQQVQFITPEEWLMMQDLPLKEYMMTRMGFQRNMKFTEEVSKILFGYADMVGQGVDPMTAINSLANDMQTQQAPISPIPSDVPAVSPEMSVPPIPPGV